MKQYLFACGFLLFLLVARNSYATHLRAGEIYAEQVNGCSSRTFKITIVVYLNSQSTVHFGGVDSFLEFGDGTSVNVPDELSPQLIDPVLHISKATFVTVHTYSLAGQYLISYSEKNRNGNILNISNSIVTLFHIETQITVYPNQCYFSAVPLVPPIDRACVGVAFFHDASAIAGGDSLSYELTVPLQGIDDPVDYTSPVDPKFYQAQDYNHANEDHDSIPSITIDPVTGILAWDAPGDMGEFGIAIKIYTWRKDPASGKWKQTGYTIRDMQIVVEDCNNKRPSLTTPVDICASPSHPVDFTVSGTDPNQDSVFIEAFSEALLLPGNPATLTPDPSVLQPFNTAQAHFSWNVSCEDVRPYPYIVIFKISDHPPTGPPLVDFKNVSIKVVGDPPEVQSLEFNRVAGESTLHWNPYPCDNTVSIQVWRRITKIHYDQGDCDFGMPSFLHYDLIAELPSDASSYTDTDISYGPQYCYRVLAVIGSDRTQSRLSLDTCIIASPVGTPIFTKTSIEKTDPTSGAVRVTWTSPVNIDTALYPPPYLYELFRYSEHNPVMTRVNPGLISDTTFLDAAGNTQDSTYFYQVRLHVPKVSANPVLYSEPTSTVRLEKQAGLNGIRLQWSATVPWSNLIEKFPYHYIYRSTSDDAGSFVLIDSVNVVQKGFTYFDDGSVSAQHLVPGQRYYYKVETVGSYGNPQLPEPLLNFSQIVNSPLLDTIPPCPPVLSISDVDCSTIPCDQTSYSNSLHWDPCGITASYYRIFASSHPDSVYTMIADHVDDLTFIDKNLPERARCYKIEAVNEFDIPSDFSNAVFAENCTGFQLPNVFTPDLQDNKNDTFIPYDADTNEENNNDPSKCYRSVTSSAINIYDRWGKVIFSASSTSEVPISWSGRNSQGQEVAAGTYFYAVRVNFRLTSWKQESKIYKGWVQLLR